jgi:hypothetical protein
MRCKINAYSSDNQTFNRFLIKFQHSRGEGGGEGRSGQREISWGDERRSGQREISWGDDLCLTQCNIEASRRANYEFPTWSFMIKHITAITAVVFVVDNKAVKRGNKPPNTTATLPQTLPQTGKMVHHKAQHHFKRVEKGRLFTTFSPKTALCFPKGG